MKKQKQRTAFENRIRFDNGVDDKDLDDMFGYGPTIWVDGTWVMDASTFSKKGEVIIDTKRMKVIKIDKKNNKIVYRLDRRLKE